METAVRCRNLTKRFNGVVALDGITLEVRAGEFFCLLGSSGSGKTTLLRLIAGLERPETGAISIGNRAVAGPGAWVPPEQRGVGMVFQDFALFPHLDVRRNVAFGMPRVADPGSRVRELLELVGLTGLESRFPFELSGGQQQRVALARTLAGEPGIIALDEPFSNLDAGLRRKLREDVRDILTKCGCTVIYVTHDQEEALSLSDRVAVMHAGRILQVDTPRNVYERPSSRKVAELTGEANLLPGLARNGEVRCELGSFALDRPAMPAGAVEVMIRPENLTVTPDPAGGGTVVRLGYLGHDQVAKVELASGRRLIARFRSPDGLRVGETVAVAAALDPVVF